MHCIFKGLATLRATRRVKSYQIQYFCPLKHTAKFARRGKYAIAVDIIHMKAEVLRPAAPNKTSDIENKMNEWAAKQSYLEEV